MTEPCMIEGGGEVRGEGREEEGDVVTCHKAEMLVVEVSTLFKSFRLRK